MGVRITSQEKVVALFDSVTGFAFGPTFQDEESADAFLVWLRDRDGRDARSLSDREIGELHRVWWVETGRAES